jgi:hypothetical protein
MATRPIFKPLPGIPPYVEVIETEFEWYPGFSVAQAQRSVAALHSAAALKGIAPLLEISSKSLLQLGVQLSAFNLRIRYDDHLMTVECAFQGSKVFVEGGPYQDLYAAPSRAAKRDPRLTNSGNLIGFRLFNNEMPMTPVTAFYDWLYFSALMQNWELAAEIIHYNGFSDIAFNPERSWNCQARSAALFVALTKSMDVKRIADIDDFLTVIQGDQVQSLDIKSDSTGQMSFL